MGTNFKGSEIIQNSNKGDKNKKKMKWENSYFEMLGLRFSSKMPLIEKTILLPEGVVEVSIIDPCS